MLRRLVSSRELDEAERFREAAARHETEARTAGVDPREAMAGAGALAEWARRFRGRDLPRRRSPGGRGLVRGGRETRACFRNAADARRQEGRAGHQDVPAGLRRSPVRGRCLEAWACRSARRNRTPGTTGRRCFAGRGSECSVTARARSSTIRSASALRVSGPSASGFAKRWTGLQRQRCNAARKSS